MPTAAATTTPATPATPAAPTVTRHVVAWTIDGVPQEPRTITLDAGLDPIIDASRILAVAATTAAPTTVDALDPARITVTAHAPVVTSANPTDAHPSLAYAAQLGRDRDGWQQFAIVGGADVAGHLERSSRPALLRFVPYL